VEMETAFHKGVWRVALTEQSVDKDAYEADITLTPWVRYFLLHYTTASVFF
jgi:hypothetical protein